MHQRAVGVLGFQVGDCYEFTLRQFDDVVTPVHDLDLVGFQLGDNIPGLVIPVGIEDVGGDIGALEVATEHRFRLHQ